MKDVFGPSSLFVLNFLSDIVLKYLSDYLVDTFNGAKSFTGKEIIKVKV